MKLIKKLYLLLFIFSLIFIACKEDTILIEIKNLEQKLLKTKSSKEEKEILTRIWELGYIEHKVDMGLSAIDENDNKVIQNLSSVKGKVEVTMFLKSNDKNHKNSWNYIIVFFPIDINNVYILLRE